MIDGALDGFILGIMVLVIGSLLVITAPVWIPVTLFGWVCIKVGKRLGIGID